MNARHIGCDHAPPGNFPVQLHSPSEFLLITYNQPLSPRQFRLLPVKGKKFIDLQRNSRRNMQKIERPCAKLRSSSCRNLRSLTKDFVAERLKLEYSSANVFSKEL